MENLVIKGADVTLEFEKQNDSDHVDLDIYTSNTDYWEMLSKEDASKIVQYLVDIFELKFI